MYTSFDDIPLEKIVRLLKSYQSDFLSGEQLSRSLNLSRAAVWKHIKKLQSFGYKIQSRPNLGYKLLAKPELLLPWEVTDGLQTDTLGRKIYYFDVIDSTQSFALRLASKPYENGSVVIAGRQTKGRGRLNRKWVSPKGGIWLSILLKPDFEVSCVSLFPMITSLALAKAIEKALKLKTKLKWPNDVTLNRKKVAGILIDASIESNKIDYLIIGVGINFKIQPRTVSRLVKNSENFYGSTTLITKNKDACPVELLQKFLYELEQLYKKILSDNLNEIRKEWIKRSSTIGRNIIISTPHGPIEGKAISIDENGALLLSNKGKIRRLLVGDVSY
jgi:BirA family transcriptional regulator, biotin operon repressor / biotin---[acetyl-CoA-carboxylase] ligase